MPYKIYVDFSMPAESRARLEEGTKGHELIFPKSLAASVLSDTPPEPAFYDCDIAFGQPNPNAIKESKSIKWIQVNTSGITRYDTDEFRQAMAERKLPVCNSASVYNEACAEHALSFMLAQSRQLPEALGFRTANDGDDWFRLRRGSVSLKGQRLLIIGYGAIARRLVELLAPFEMRIEAYRRTPTGDELVPILDQRALPHSLERADHIINILPDSPSTRNYFDSELFSLLKPGVVFYNIGRGTTVDQDALHQHLSSGHIRSAWLDVTEPEPLPDGHPLLSLDNCHITPHIAGGHEGENTHCVEHFLENLKRFENGDDLKDRVM